MTEVWIVIAALAVGTVAIKAAGPLVLGSRPLPRRAQGVIALIAPAVITALVAYETFSDHPDGIVVDARVAGLAAAALALALRAPMIVVVVVAAAVTGGVRALT
jgi:uncharacterized membrane protein